LLGRCWTADRLARGGLPHADMCVLCDQVPECMEHLLAGCSFSRQVWHEVLSWCRSTTPPPSPTSGFREWWRSSYSATPATLQKGFASTSMLCAWCLWKHRKEAIFNNQTPSVSQLVSAIKEEASTWARAGAIGRACVLPVIY
uniref:Reverse transcriptase zinc-binding domain-containing protein n=1 Tax=Aegilops tauschii subsp. strangulata TaxID=200361 RepID=A0A453S5Z5_AEGTS